VTSEEARELFSEAFEDDLEEDRKTAFLGALDADAELKAEYDDFVETFALVGKIGEDVQPPPDLLRGVQERLRKRSRGRYYRDRFSRRAGPAWMLPMILVVTVLTVLAVAWFALQTTVVLDDVLDPVLDPVPDEAGDQAPPETE
jgi:hypothetical protein